MITMEVLGHIGSGVDGGAIVLGFLAVAGLVGVALVGVARRRKEALGEPADQTTVHRIGITVSVGGPFRHFWRVEPDRRSAQMSTAPLTTDDVRDSMADASLILEDLLRQIEELRATGGDPLTIAELWAQVDLLQGR